MKSEEVGMPTEPLNRSRICVVGTVLMVATGLLLSSDAGWSQNKVRDRVTVTDVIDKVEFVQVIQTLQTIDDLQASLKANGQPPVAMLAGKPTALRVYTKTGAGAYSVVATLPGEKKDVTQKMVLDKKNGADQQRLGLSIQSSPIFYFKPPEGGWSVTLKVFDKDNMELAGALTFDFTKSPAQQTLDIFTVFVCDAKKAGAWQCPQKNTVGDAVLRSRFKFMVGLLPTTQTPITPTGTTIELDKSTYLTDAAWYVDVLKQMGEDAKKKEMKDAPPAGTHPFYLGLARPEVKTNIVGMAGNIPGRTALALSMSESPYEQRKGIKFDDTNETWAHEISHGLGLRHTNLDIPMSDNYPGCYLKAKDPGTDWPFADNRVRSKLADGSTPLEVGYNVSQKQIVKAYGKSSIPTAENYFELMAYCLPQWTAPINYNKAAASLAPGAALPPPGPAKSAAAGTASKPASDIAYWEVTGNINNGVAAIDPLFQSMLPGPGDSGSGAYQVVVTDAGGNILWQQYFDPHNPVVEYSDDSQVDSGQYFTEAVPYNAGAQRISVLDSGGSEIGHVLLGGLIPYVKIVTPLSGKTISGLQQLNWVTSRVPVAASRVEYSSDLGATWIQIAQNPDTGLLFDFATVPGSDTNAALIRVSVSDGVNMGQVVSDAFTVTKKTPSDPVIANPTDGASNGPGDAVVLEGGALQTDVILTGDEVAWSSDIDGALGTGETLTLSQLSPGNHTITMKATNIGGLYASTMIGLNVASDLPTVAVTSPSNCVVRFNATADPYVKLASFAYSVDGGNTYTSVGLGSLPLDVSIASGNSVSAIGYAMDAAGQLGFDDEDFQFDPPCDGAGVSH